MRPGTRKPAPRHQVHQAARRASTHQETAMTPDAARPSAIVDPQGKPARQAIDTHCPNCGAGVEKRVASCGFGVRRPVCGSCGYKWDDEVWSGD